jgi:hypothetical protein
MESRTVLKQELGAIWLDYSSWQLLQLNIAQMKQRAALCQEQYTTGRHLAAERSDCMRPNGWRAPASSTNPISYPGRNGQQYVAIVSSGINAFAVE